MKRRTTMVALVALALVTLAASATDWPQFQKDEINTGWTTDYAPIYDPTLIWYNQTTGTGMGGIDVVPVVGDGQVFVLDYVGNVWAFNATTGQLNWNKSCTAPGTFELSTPAYNDGVLYVATSAGDLNQGYCKVTALYANNGTERENITLKTTGGYQLYTPVTYADDRIYLGDWNGSATATNGSGTYYCLDASNVSDKLWNYTPNRVSCGYRWAGAAIIGEYILFGDTAANVTCLYNDNGTFVDYINISEVCGCSNPVEEIRSSIAWNESTGHIYFTAGKQDGANFGYGTGHVYAVAFNATTGDLNDTCTWNNDTWYTTSTPVYYDDRIYVGGGAQMGFANGPGRMRCLNATNGSMIWEKWDTNIGRVQASPVLSVVGGRKFIYYTTNVHNGSAYCLEDVGDDYETRWVWNPPAPDNQYILQGMAVSDGFVYFGTDYGRIYALGNPPVHNLNTGENFSTIQAAINDSNTQDGHMITVDAGTYYENVDIVTKSLTIRSTSGNHDDTVVQALDSNDHVFEVTADYVNISGFAVKGATGDEKAGIYLYGANHSVISDNNVSNNYYGVRVSSLWYCNIDNNIISNNLNAGISVK